MKKLALLVAFAVCAAMSLSAQKYEKVIDTQARANDAVSTIYIKPTVAEVELAGNGTRIKDDWKLTKADFDALQQEFPNIRAWATYMSSVKHNCDIIMAPTYKIESDAYTGDVLVTIAGYPGNFVNWHSATDEDYKWIIRQKEMNTPQLPVVKDKN